MSLTETIVDEEFIQQMSIYSEVIKGKGLLEACNESIILFSIKMLGFRLRSWQICFLVKIQKAIAGNYFTKEFLAMTSRQIGKSAAVAVLALWVCVFNKYTGGGKDMNSAIGIISASDGQAKKLLREIKKFILLGDNFMKKTYDYKIAFFSSLIDPGEPNNMTTITFKPYSEKVHGEFLLKDSLIGSFIMSYPPTQVILGNTFSICLIDEAGRTDKITDIVYLDFISPTTDELDAIVIYTSTPWESSGQFYRLVDPDDVYDSSEMERLLFTVEAIRIEAPERYERTLKKIEKLNRDGKIAEVQRAYYCRFVKGDKNYFDPDSVREVFRDDERVLSSFSDVCDIGVDFGGQVKSRTAITISYMDDNDTVHRLYHKAYEVQKDLTLIEDIEFLMKHFNIQRVIPDDCPAGDFLIRKMVEKGWDVHPMNFRSEKVKKYGAFRSKVNKDQICSYHDDELKTEMLALENSAGSRQSVISAPKGYSDDLIDSFVLSSYFFLVVEQGGVKFFNRKGLFERKKEDV